MSSSVIDKISPFSCIYPNKTSFSMTLRIFGCTCFVQDLSSGLDKLSPRFIKCVFVGYCRTQKGYCRYNPSTRVFGVYWYYVLWVYSIFLSTGSCHYIWDCSSFTVCVVAYTCFYCFFAGTASRNSGPPATEPVRDLSWAISIWLLGCYPYTHFVFYIYLVIYLVPSLMKNHSISFEGFYFST